MKWLLILILAAGCHRPLMPDSITVTAGQSDFGDYRRGNNVGLSVSATWGIHPLPVEVTLSPATIRALRPTTRESE